jgi:hypothetical protein
MISWVVGLGYKYMNIQQAKDLMESEVVQNFIDTCPHCGTRAHLKLLFSESYKEENGDLVYYHTFRCVPCKGLVLETYKFNQNKYTNNEDLKPAGWNNKFPTEEIVFIKKFDGVIPDDVFSDFKEGVVCLKNKCPKAAASMFRRSLQSSLINKGADSSLDLIEQIKNVKNLTDDIKDWAHNIRIFGNWGAHPQDDNLKDVSLELASEVKDFLEEFFNYVYLMPSRVAKARSLNQKKNEDKVVEETKK